ncbi:MAG: patatin-like phospholipase family protein [Hyphomicrobiales bacterium]|nr:patatin-like phospholipase family protein [Hyphomicrobiales bacterium]
MAANPLDLLAILGPEGRKAVEAEAEWIAVPAGRTLFHHGDPGNALYLVVSGSLGVYMPGPGDEPQLIGLIESGETVGEMALISGLPRSATVTAIRDSELWRVTKARFDLLLKRQPELLAGLNRILVHRLRQVSRGQGTRIEPKTVAFLPAGKGIDPQGIAERLSAEVTALGYKVRLVGTEDAGRSSRWFHELEKTHDHIFLCAALGDPAWIRLCARQADRIFIIARSRDPAGTALPRDLLAQRAAHQLLDLVLLHKDGSAAPADANRWLEAIPVNRHFHLRLDNAEDWSRIARIVAGRAIGLVLSGGGARAYAHVGVIRAIRDAGLPIDFLGGTSMGAIIGAGLAMEWSIDELERRVHDAFVTSNPLNDYTLPLVSLVKGRKMERLFEENFGWVRIPDLWRPYFCISSNLTSGDLHIHRRDRLTEALRASVALPGVLPPKVVKDGVLVDGAVLNNLPVDVMRGTHRGPIIAVDVARDRAMTPEMVALDRRRSWLSWIVEPPIVSILMRAGTVSGEPYLAEQARAADLLIEPPLGDIDIRNWRAFDQAVEIGYEHARQVLASSGHLLRRQRRPQPT